mgnify:CR=1 FL=1
MGNQLLKALDSACPFLKIVIGEPFVPSELQGLCVSLLSEVCTAVELKRSELPHLPSKIISPSTGYKFLQMFFQD